MLQDRNNKKITDEEIEKAKEYPIQWLFNSNQKRTGKIIRIKCMFPNHRDTNPSFTIYHDTNTWYCFGGCGGGDIIKLLKLLTNASFVDVINYLNNKN